MKTIFLTAVIPLFASLVSAEDWSKNACKQAQKKDRWSFQAFYMEEAGFGGVLRSMSGGTTSEIRFTLASPQVIKRNVCDLKKFERLSNDEAEAEYRSRLAAHRSGYIPVLVQIKNNDNRFGPSGPAYGGDASAAHHVFLQDKKNNDLFLREVGESREELFQGYSEWSLAWQGTALAVLFPYDEEFFSTARQVEIEIRYGGQKGKPAFLIPKDWELIHVTSVATPQGSFTGAGQEQLHNLWFRDPEGTLYMFRIFDAVSKARIVDLKADKPRVLRMKRSP